MSTGIYNKNATIVRMYDENNELCTLYVDPKSKKEVTEILVLSVNQWRMLVEMFTSLPEEKRYNYTMKMQYRGDVVMKAYCYAHYDRYGTKTGEMIRFNYIDNVGRFSILVEYNIRDDVWTFVNPDGEEVQVKGNK